MTVFACDDLCVVKYPCAQCACASSYFLHLLPLAASAFSPRQNSTSVQCAPHGCAARAFRRRKHTRAILSLPPPHSHRRLVKISRKSALFLKVSSILILYSKSSSWLTFEKFRTCTYIHIYVHTNIHSHLLTYKHTYIHTNTYNYTDIPVGRSSKATALEFSSTSANAFNPPSWHPRSADSAIQLEYFLKGQVFSHFVTYSQ